MCHIVDGGIQSRACNQPGGNRQIISITVEDHFAKIGETRAVPLNTVAVDALQILENHLPWRQVFRRRDEKRAVAGVLGKASDQPLKPDADMLN